MTERQRRSLPKGSSVINGLRLERDAAARLCEAVAADNGVKNIAEYARFCIRRGLGCSHEEANLREGYKHEKTSGIAGLGLDLRTKTELETLSAQTGRTKAALARHYIRRALGYSEADSTKREAGFAALAEHYQESSGRSAEPARMPIEPCTSFIWRAGALRALHDLRPGRARRLGARSRERRRWARVRRELVPQRRRAGGEARGVEYPVRYDRQRRDVKLEKPEDFEFAKRLDDVRMPLEWTLRCGACGKRNRVVGIRAWDRKPRCGACGLPLVKPA